ncbi:MAG: sigma-70 family RNA polymerase sigma factor [bacterium]|nr:sigma-70 family RNA polymerase sigma factor [bacterium]
MTPAAANPEDAKGEITHLLVAWSQGDLEALDKVFPLAFEDLRRIARKCCGRIPAKDLQPTELIGEIYATLLKQRKVRWECRGQFYQFAALLMERVLLSYRRGLDTEKRGGRTTQVPLIEALGFAVAGDASSISPAVEDDRQAEVLDALSTGIDVAGKIAELAKLDPRQAEIARLRYLIGLTLDETAETLGVSRKTVTRNWLHAKRFLALELDEYASERPDPPAVRTSS